MLSVFFDRNPLLQTSLFCKLFFHGCFACFFQKMFAVIYTCDTAVKSFVGEASLACGDIYLAGETCPVNQDIFSLSLRREEGKIPWSVFICPFCSKKQIN